MFSLQIVTSALITFIFVLAFPGSFVSASDCFTQNGKDIGYKWPCKDSQITLKITQASYLIKFTDGVLPENPDSANIKFTFGDCVVSGVFSSDSDGKLSFNFDETNFYFPATIKVLKDELTFSGTPQWSPWSVVPKVIGTCKPSFDKIDDGYKVILDISPGSKITTLSAIIKGATIYLGPTSTSGTPAWLIAVIVLGIVVFSIVCILVVFCVFKTCIKQNKPRQVALIKPKVITQKAMPIESTYEESRSVEPKTVALEAHKRTPKDHKMRQRMDPSAHDFLGDGKMTASSASKSIKTLNQHESSYKF